MRRPFTLALVTITLVGTSAAAIAVRRGAQWPPTPEVYTPLVSAGGPPQVLRDPEAYAVFNMILSDILNRHPRIIGEKPLGIARRLRLPGGVPPDWWPVAQDAREKNSRWWTLDRSWSPGSSWHLLTGDALDEPVPVGPGTGFGPDRLSVPGFNDAKTRALIFVAYPDFPDCCEAWFALEKINGRWVESANWRLGFGG